ncbi:uncharacterized protein FYW61_013415 [Anableps anableps]
MDDQRRLLDFSRTPRIILHRIDHLLDFVRKDEEEVFSDQQLCKQERDPSLDLEEPEPLQMKEEQQEPEHPWIKEEPLELCIDLLQEYVRKEEALADLDRNSSFDEEEPEPVQMKEEQVELEHLQIKEEEKELCISQDEEQLGLKQETETFMVTPTNEEFHTEPEANWNQLSSPDSPETENEDQETSNPEVSGSMMDEEQIHQKIRHHNNDSNNSQEKGQKKTHRDKKLYFCEMCDKGFSLNKNLVAHMRIHTGERPFSCKACGKCFTKKSNLTRHLKTHTGEKPFPCDACKKTFSLKRDLVKHMRIHTGEKPFLCMTCGKRFRLKFILTEHIRTHTGERPFPCDTCKKTFSLKRNVVKHMRNCGKHLKSKGNFNTNRIIHTEQRPLSW